MKKEILLLLACIIWTIAGFNILRIGILAYKDNLSMIHIILSLVVFLVFQVLIFKKLVEKHTNRIIGYEEEFQMFLKFFDLKSFMIMAFMMTGGILLRTSNICPEQFIAVFYSGLGASLLLAGILFGWNFKKYR